MKKNHPYTQKNLHCKENLVGPAASGILIYRETPCHFCKWIIFADFLIFGRFICTPLFLTRKPEKESPNIFLIIKKIQDIKKRKINTLKQIKNRISYLSAVMKAKYKKGKKSRVKSLQHKMKLKQLLSMKLY